HLSMILVAAVLLFASFAAARISRQRVTMLWPLLLVPASAAISAILVLQIEDVSGDRGFAFLLLATIYAALVGASFLKPRSRDLITLLAAPASAFLALALIELASSEQLLAVALCAVAAGLLLLANAVREPRFQFYAGAFAAGAVGLTFVRLTPPSHLLKAVEHPASGIGALAACIALAVLALSALRGDSQGDRADVEYARLIPDLRVYLAWFAPGAALYLASLLVLEVFHHVGTVEVQTAFQRGETGVSALW